MVTREEAVQSMDKVLEYLSKGESKVRPDMAKTPERYIKAMEEMTTPQEFSYTSFDNPDKEDKGMVVQGPINFISNCFDGKTRVRVDHSVHGVYTKFIKDLKIGDSVMTYNEDGQLFSKPITDISVHRSGDIYELVVQGRKTYVTGDHEYYTADKELKKVKDLTSRDMVYIVRTKNGDEHPNHKNMTYKYSPKLGYILGCLLSDGYLWRNAFRMKVVDKWFADKLADAVKEVFGLTVEVHSIMSYSSFRKKKIPMFEVRVISGQVVSILKELTQNRYHSKDHRVPGIVLNDYDIFQQFIEGYLDGDGSGYKPGRTSQKWNRIHTSNKAFADEISSIFRSCVTATDKTGTMMYNISIPLFINDRHKREIFKTRFIEHFESNIQNIEPITIEQDRMLASVESVKKLNTGATRNVYNLTVGEGSSYIANDIWVKNCAHHTYPFQGEAWVAYIPGEKIVGLSKLARCVKETSKRFGVQEEITNDIAGILEKELKPLGVAVYMRATHGCMAWRGVKCSEANTITTKFTGAFKDSLNTRQEFLSYIDK